jgi:hypothetical protein
VGEVYAVDAATLAALDRDPHGGRPRSGRPDLSLPPS